MEQITQKIFVHFAVCAKFCHPHSIHHTGTHCDVQTGGNNESVRKREYVINVFVTQQKDPTGR